MLETSVGDIIIDLHTDLCPNTARNFLKLCKCKYYNGVLFHNVQKDYIIQAGDPTGTGRGGESMFGYASPPNFTPPPENDEAWGRRSHVG
jgi:peptidyl-prolyl cis-trans isomerase-like 4